MVENEDTFLRKIQKHGSNNQYFRVTLPAEFAEGKEQVNMKISGDLLLLKEAFTEDQKELVVDIDKFRSNGTLDLQLILEVLPSWAMADYDRIRIEKPDDQREKAEINNVLTSAKNRPFLEWNRDEFCLELSKYSYEDFVKDIDEFLAIHFMETLEGITDLDNLNREFEDDFLKHNTWKDYEEPHNVIHKKEQAIDRNWALTSKNAAETFQSLELDQFPRAIGKIHVANKLERVVDHAFVILALLYDSYKNDEETTEKFRNDLKSVFIDPRFDDQVKNIGMKCFSGEIRIEDVIEQKDGFDDRQDRLYKVHENYLHEGNLIMGEIIGQCYELIRCPSSLAIAGLGSKYASE